MFSRSLLLLVSAVLSLLLNGASTPAEPDSTPPSPAVDPKLPRYVKPTDPLKGQLKIGGSGTMERFIRALIEQFSRLHPEVSYDITLRGSTYTPSGLAQQEYNVGLMSRAMTPVEKASVKKKTGRDSIELVVAADAILVLVNKDNPIEGITLPQLDALFGTKTLAGYNKPVAVWKDLGVKADLAAEKISPYGILEEKNGTVETFRQLVLLGGPLNPKVGNIKFPEKEFGQAVAADRMGISYNMHNPPVAGAKAIGVAAKEGDPFVLADPTTIGNRKYPLSRYLYIYLRDTSEPAVVEFLRFALSFEGQQIVAANSATSLSAPFAEKQRERIAK